MHVTTIETAGLGDRSYLIDDGSSAIVIDPQRDVDRVQALLEARGLELALICETHIHNDYVTGGLALARLTGADYAVNADDEVTYARRPVGEGDEITVGAMAVRVLATPGHTPTHLSYVVDAGDKTGGVFTGGSMLYGTVGRTDLIGPDKTERLTRDQHRSVRRMAEMLPPTTTVHPTHGFGSFCASAGGGSRSSGTIQHERDENIAVTTPDEDEFVTMLMDGFTAHPPYYVHMGLLNRAGPLMPDLSPPPRATPEELAARIAGGEWVVDLRARTAFPQAHLPGSISTEVGTSLATYLGWAIPWGTPVTLIGEDDQQVAEAQRELVRIGIDRPLAMATGGPDVYGAGLDLASYRRASFADLADEPDAEIVDVRRDDEWAEGHLAGAIHVPMEQLADQAEQLPDGELWVHCASGFRSSIASSIIARAGKRVVYIDDEFDSAADSGRPIVGGEHG